MSYTATKAQSGLRTLKKEFVDSSSDNAFGDWQPTQLQRVPSFPDSSQTQPSHDRSTPNQVSDAPDGRSARLNAILAALKDKNDSATPDNSSNRKRPSDEHAGPAKKKRVLPFETGSTDSGNSQRRTKVDPHKVFLSSEQKHILKIVQQGHNVFYTGSAGTGKSVLLREIIKSLKFKHARSPDAVGITASTGIAACNIGGVTIHSFAGIGLGLETAEKLASKIKKNRKSLTRWQRTKVLIIDEVSMMDGDLFDKLSRIGSLLRKDPKPFGGIQVIVTGDFFQLPPVTHGEPKFAFEAQSWSDCMTYTFNLTQVFRQADPAFVNMLNEMRFGLLSAASIARFKSLARPIKYDDNIMPTELFPRRENVDATNSTRNRSINGETFKYHASDSGAITDLNQRDKLLQNCMYPKVLELKVGSQVMLIKNLPEMQLVNGSVGEVIRFTDRNDPEAEAADEKENSNSKKTKAKKERVMLPLVRFKVGRDQTVNYLMETEDWKYESPDGEVLAQRRQLPLILSWAMSIHKSQGQTLDRVKVDLSRIFEKGQAYVALSRATSLDGLQVLGFDEKKVMAHPKVIEWSKTLLAITSNDK